MGNCNQVQADESEEAQRARAVDLELAALEAQEENNFKILLLGAGESGKSTVVKQIKLIYKGGVSKKEREEYASAIRRNCIESMQTLLEAMVTLKIQFADENLIPVGEKLEDLGTEDTLTEELSFEIDSLWRDAGLQECYERRDEFWLLDACNYYFENAIRLGEDVSSVVVAGGWEGGITRLSSPNQAHRTNPPISFPPPPFTFTFHISQDYVPNDEDMIMTRVRTTGIVVTEFDDDINKYQLVDVGGQRSERRKWMHCFDDVKAIIFLEGLSSYHQVLFEDSSVNRMHESLQLFGDVVKNPIFEGTPIFLFLNKKDLFEDMIKKQV